MPFCSDGQRPWGMFVWHDSADQAGGNLPGLDGGNCFWKEDDNRADGEGGGAVQAALCHRRRGQANGSCMGSAMFGAVAAGRRGGGYDTIEEAVNAMGPPVGKTYIPSQSASVVYDALFEMYREMYLYLGKDSSMLKRLAAMRGKEK